MQDQKDMQGILLDAISEQIRGMQSITRLLTGKLEKVLNISDGSLQRGMIRIHDVQPMALHPWLQEEGLV